jgi:hypothetical protein
LVHLAQISAPVGRRIAVPLSVADAGNGPLSFLVSKNGDAAGFDVIFEQLGATEGFIWVTLPKFAVEGIGVNVAISRGSPESSEGVLDSAMIPVVGYNIDSSPPEVPLAASPYRNNEQIASLSQSAPDAKVAYLVQITDLDGALLTSVAPGQQFALHIYVRDLRAQPHGVFAGYLDVRWDSSLASVVDNIQYSERYFNGLSGNPPLAGLMNEVGGFSGPSEARGGTYELFAVRMLATGAGRLVFASDPADVIPSHNTLIYAVDGPVPADETVYGGASIVIGAAQSLITPPSDEIPPMNVAAPESGGATIARSDLRQLDQPETLLILDAPADIQPIVRNPGVSLPSLLVSSSSLAAETVFDVSDVTGDASGMSFSKISAVAQDESALAADGTFPPDASVDATPGPGTKYSLLGPSL